MSYEGHVQAICEHGHRYDYDAYATFSDNRTGTLCSGIRDGNICGGKEVFENGVDDTNCDSYGEILPQDWEKFKATEKVVEECPCCKHVKVINDATYKIPTDKDRNLLRTYREVDEQIGYVTYCCETGAVIEVSK